MVLRLEHLPFLQAIIRHDKTLPRANEAPPAIPASLYCSIGGGLSIYLNSDLTSIIISLELSVSLIGQRLSVSSPTRTCYAVVKTDRHPLPDQKAVVKVEKSRNIIRITAHMLCHQSVWETQTHGAFSSEARMPGRG